MVNIQKTPQWERRQEIKRISRRKFLKIGLASFAGGVAVGAGGDKMMHSYFNNSKMEVLFFPEYVLFDLHTHIAKSEGLEETLRRIVHVGGVGASLCNPAWWERKPFSDDDERFCYENLVRSKPKGIGIEEVNSGRFARVEINGDFGYLVKVHEISSKEGFHVLAIGCPVDMPHNTSVEDIANAVHEQGGLVQLNHFYTISSDEPSMIPYRQINEKEEKILGRIAREVDLLEEANAQQIDLFPWIKSGIFSKVNTRERNMGAIEFVNSKNYFHKATRNSDAHNLLEQVGVMGNFIPVDHAFCWEGVRYALSNGLHRVSDYQEVSRKSFLIGMEKFPRMVEFLA